MELRHSSLAFINGDGCVDMNLLCPKHEADLLDSALSFPGPNALGHLSLEADGSTIF